MKCRYCGLTVEDESVDHRIEIQFTTYKPVGTEGDAVPITPTNKYTISCKKLRMLSDAADPTIAEELAKKYSKS